MGEETAKQMLRIFVNVIKDLLRILLRHVKNVMLVNQQMKCMVNIVWIILNSKQPMAAVLLYPKTNVTNNFTVTIKTDVVVFIQIDIHMMIIIKNAANQQLLMS